MQKETYLLVLVVLWRGTNRLEIKIGFTIDIISQEVKRELETKRIMVDSTHLYFFPSAKARILVQFIGTIISQNKKCG